MKTVLDGYPVIKLVAATPNAPSLMPIFCPARSFGSCGGAARGFPAGKTEAWITGATNGFTSGDTSFGFIESFLLFSFPVKLKVHASLGSRDSFGKRSQRESFNRIAFRSAADDKYFIRFLTCKILANLFVAEVRNIINKQLRSIGSKG